MATPTKPDDSEEPNEDKQADEGREAALNFFEEHRLLMPQLMRDHLVR